ncbi:MAG: hypothetical protein HYR95_01590 [Candidatus Colwellbacteria bacterium]|nr:hypothetical protein [Candidatus Colwellbacteria bacterium]
MDKLDERSSDILTRRYGLQGEKSETLASLGGAYGLTRERVRQIEQNSLRILREAIDRKEAADFVALIHDYLNKMGNLRRNDLLVSDLRTLLSIKYEKSVFERELYLFAKVMGEPDVVESTDDWHRIWHNDIRAYKKAIALAEHLMNFKERDFGRFIKVAVIKFELPESMILNYLSASKNFGIGPYNDLGAKHWIHVNPRTVRDKSFLVLRKAGAPMHFKEVATLVNKLDGTKRAHPATVHNELIKDPRFILMGRGTYTLREHLKS